MAVPCARRTIDDDEHLIRRRRHEPELGGIELRVAGNGRRRFRRRGAALPTFHCPAHTET